jgi:ribose transport system permease protein
MGMEEAVGRTKVASYYRNFWLSKGIYIILILVFALFAVIFPAFRSGKNIVNLLTQSCTMILVCTGMTLCLLIKGMDLSVGSIMYVSAAVMFMLLKHNRNLSIPPAILVGLVVGAAIGILNGVIVASLRVYALLPTLATMYAFRGIGLSLAGGSVSQMPMKWLVIVSEKLFGLPVYVYISFFIAILTQIFLNYTKLGRHIYATGDNEKMAREKGIAVYRIKLFVYCMCGITAAMAAVVSSGMTMQVSFSLGEGFEFKVITACVLGGVSLNGGRGTVFPGVIIGALILSCISNALVLLKASPLSYDIVYALIIFIVVLLDTIKSHSEKTLP